MSTADGMAAQGGGMGDFWINNGKPMVGAVREQDFR